MGRPMPAINIATDEAAMPAEARMQLTAMIVGTVALIAVVLAVVAFFVRTRANEGRCVEAEAQIEADASDTHIVIPEEAKLTQHMDSGYVRMEEDSTAGRLVKPARSHHKHNSSRNDTITPGYIHKSSNTRRMRIITSSNSTMRPTLAKGPGIGAGFPPRRKPQSAAPALTSA